MNKHPHAELMKQYAEDAMRTATPWRLWEVRQKESTQWSQLTEPSLWSPNCEYRRKQKVIEIDGMKFPIPITTTNINSKNQEYFTIGLTDSGIVAARIKPCYMKADKFQALFKQGWIFEQIEDCELYIESLAELNKKVISYFHEDSQKEN